MYRSMEEIITLLANNFLKIRLCLIARPTARSFRKVLTSVGEQGAEHLGNPREMQTQSPFPARRWKG